MASLNADGGQAHPAAAELLARDIRQRLEELGAVLSL
jgi:type VI protein secretion system component VasK